MGCRQCNKKINSENELYSLSSSREVFDISNDKRYAVYEYYCS